MGDLTLPATIPGLLRRGSPVRGTIGDFPDIAGIFLTDDADRPGRACCVAVAAFPNYGEIMAWPWMEVIGLDLTDATGRNHAAGWLSARLAPDDGPYITAAVMPGRWFGPVLFGLLTVSVNDGARMLRCGDPSPFECTDDLDCNDNRRLPDGSRWVDAEALRRVVLHVAEKGTA